MVSFADVMRNGIKQNIYSGPEREIETILPVGDEKSNFEYVVRVTVEDKYAFGVTSDFKVKVWCLENSSLKIKIWNYYDN